MFNRIVIAFLAIILMINTSMAASHSGVKAAFDEFHYVMTVEGASLDPVSSNETIEIFRHKLLALESQGVGRGEIIDTVLSGISDEKTAAQIKNVLVLMEAEKLGAQEADLIIKNILSESYLQGASWNGNLHALQVLGVMILSVSLLIGLLSVATRSPNCPPHYSDEQCDQLN